MQKRKAYLITLVMILLLALVPFDSVHAAKIKVKSVKVQEPYAKTIEVAKKKSVKIVPVVTVTPNKKANKKVSFTSKNKKIATVNAKGVVKGKKPGKTKIVVTSKKNKKKKATISVVVKKNPIQKVSLDKTSVVLEPNMAALLKATITAKSGSSKKIYWTSSNPSVATVSQSGNIVAKKVGTATITAKAIDGSKKKATCQVTVKQKEAVKPVKPAVVNLHSVAVNNYYMLTFTLDNPCKLQAGQVSLMMKQNKEDSYVDKMTISNLTTTDNKTYKVEMSTKQAFYDNGYLLLSIPTLSGAKKQLEVQIGDMMPAYRSKGYASKYSVNTSVDYNMCNLSSGEDYKVEGLLPGLTIEKRNNSLYVIGKVSKVGASLVKVRIFKNNRLTRIHEWPVMVYDDSHIVAAPINVYTQSSYSDCWVNAWINCAGGSGSYTYSIVGDSYGLEMDGSYLEGYLYVPGEYSVVVEIKDVKNPNISCRVNVNIYYSETVTYLINVKDASGQLQKDGVKVSLINQDNDGRAGTYNSYVGNGILSGDVVAGTYDIYVVSEYGDSVYKVYDNVVLDRSKFVGTVKTPLSRVELAANNGQTSFDKVYWYDQNDDLIGFGQTLYLEKGTYNIHSKQDKNMILLCLKQLTAKFDVKNAAMVANVTITDLQQPDPVYDMGIGVTPVSLGKGEYIIYKFIPSVTGTYKLTTDCNNYLILSNTDEYFTQEQSYSYFYSSSSKSITMTKGKTYYFKVSYNSSSNAGDFNLTLQKTN